MIVNQEYLVSDIVELLPETICEEDLSDFIIDREIPLDKEGRISIGNAQLIINFFSSNGDDYVLNKPNFKVSG